MPQGEAVSAIDAPEWGNMEVLVPYGALANDNKRADIGMGFTERIVDFVDNAPAMTIRSVPEPKGDGREAVAENPREGDQSYGAAIEADAGFGVAALGPGTQRYGGASGAVVGCAEGYDVAAIHRE